MSDVEFGGATVFLAVDGHIMPKKRSAVFWYNMFASGEGIILTGFIPHH
jgi:prolyl 4-hydroxylase